MDHEAQPTSETKNAAGHVVPEREIIEHSSSEDGYKDIKAPRNRNDDSSDEDYKEYPHNLWALRQRQLKNWDPKSEPKPWPPDVGQPKIWEPLLAPCPPW